MDINYELLEHYVNKNLVKREDRERIISESKRLGMGVREYLLSKAYVNEVNELEALAEYYCMPFIEIDMLEIDRSLVDLLGLDLMKRHKLVPVCYDKNGVLIVAIGRPFDCHAVSALASHVFSPVDFILVPPSQIDRYVDSVAAALSTSLAIDDINSESAEIAIGVKNKTGTSATTENDVINNPAVRLVDSIIKEAIPHRASDIHIEPFDRIVKVRYRIDGDLQHRAEFSIDAYSAICARLKIMAAMNIAERRCPQDGRINMAVGGKEYDLRVSTLPTVFGEKFVIRILDKGTFGFSREELGFSERDNALVDKMLARPHGIILLTGPTGCGKSTTLYSFLKEVNDPTVNIVTVEDPVEYTMPGINQTQVNTKANMTFATALRSILRQDPDVIMIGEIRDEETAEIAVRSAITGHIVFSTLHTNDAPGAILRLIDMGVADYLVADALVGVIAQRLVKRLCPVCKRSVITTQKEMDLLEIDEPIFVAKAEGCQFCNHTGYKGRVAVHEIMYMNDAMKNAVTGEKNLEHLRELAISNGMVSLWESCKELVYRGITSISELVSLNQE